MNREYLRVTPTTASLDPDTVSTALRSLNKLSTSESEGILSRFNPIRNTEPIAFEFVAISEGKDEPVEFFYGADDRLQVLKQRPQTAYPDSFDIERVETNLLEKLVEPVDYSLDQFQDRVGGDRLYDHPKEDSLTDRGVSVEADGGATVPRSPVDEVTPYGVRWRGSVDRRNDWMTTLTDFSKTIEDKPAKTDEDTSQSGRAPLSPLVVQLTEATQPLAFQVIFQRKPDWSNKARRRSGALLSGQDTLLQRVLSIESPGHRRKSNQFAKQNRGSLRSGTRWEHSNHHQPRPRDREREYVTRTRLDELRQNTPNRTFTMSARLLALPRDDENIDELNDRLDDLCTAFDTIDGPYYEVEGERFRSRGLLPRLQERIARIELERFQTRSVATRRRDSLPNLTNRADSRPDLVLNADELANFLVVPSASELTVQGSRGTPAEQRSRNPLPRPDHDITRQLPEPGLELGHLLDENGDSKDIPLRLSPDLLPFHVGRFAKTGAGKSIALVNDALSVYEQTSGPVFLIDTKGGLPENYMRAHAKRFGIEDFEENVLHFDIPETLPGFAFFNIEPALANGVPRQQAIKDRVDHYVEVLKMTMGEDRYEQAVVSPNLLKYLIRLMYGEEHGLDHGLYRESVDYFGQSQLEQVVDQLYAAGPPQSDLREAPESSNCEAPLIRRPTWRSVCTSRSGLAATRP